METGLNYETFTQELLLAAPEFRPVYEEHVADNDEVLLHMLMPEFTKFLIDKWRTSRSGSAEAGAAHQLVRRSSDLIERAMGSSDERLQNVISVSFLDYLDWAGEDYESIKSLLGPKLREELNAIETWEPRKHGDEGMFT
jgi:hypothetical protein